MPNCPLKTNPGATFGGCDAGVIAGASSRDGADVQALLVLVLWLMPWLYFFFKISLQVFVKMYCKNHEGLLAVTDLIGLDKRHSYSTHFKFWVSRDPPRPTPPLHMIVKILKDHHICNILGASPENACESNHFQKVNKNLTHHRMQQHFHTGKTIPRAFCTKKNLLCCLCSKKPTHLNVFWKGF